MDVPVADPVRAALEQRQAIDRAVTRVLESGRYVMGREHDAFEHELAAHLGVAHCAGVASGTDALELALRAVGCHAGDELVIAANAGFYSSTAALALGMRIRYADVDEATLTLSAATLAPVVGETTKAVVVTHLYGFFAEVEPITELCRSHGVAVVEDCAQAVGARRDGHFAGSVGDVAALSFYPTKNLAALGDGGAVATNDDDVAARVRALRQYGWKTKYNVAIPGGRNSRLDELQAAILRTRLPLLATANERRREIVRAYESALGSSAARLVTQTGEDSVAHLAVLLADERDRVRSRFEEAGIATDVHYPLADHRQPVWGGRYASAHLPVTEHAVEHVLTIPCYPELTEDEVARVCGVLEEI